MIEKLLEKAAIIAKDHPSKDARFFANHVLIMVTQITRENQRMRDCISALVPFLMEDYVVGVMTDDYKAAIELAIEATKTEAQNASR